MRKIFILFSLVFFVLTANFVLWFSHTRVIRSTLTDIQREWEFYRASMSYDDLYFNNFKSWNVNGVIDNLTIKLDRYIDAKLIFSRVNFISEPFKQTIELRADGDVFLITHPGTEKERNYKINYTNGFPTIELSFKTSLNEFGSKFNNTSESIIDELESFIYYDSGFTMHDLDNSSDYISIKNVKASVASTKEESGKIYNFLFKCDEMEYLDDYHSEKEDSVIDINNKKTGINSLNIDFSLLYVPKALQKQETLKHSKKGLSDGKFDTLKFKINDISMLNERYGISANGTLKKRIGIIMPKLDIVFTLTNYKEYIADVSANFNYLLETHPETRALLPYKPLSKKKIQTLSEFIGKYEINSHDIRFRINNSDTTLRINEQDLLNFMIDLQEIMITPDKSK